MMFAKRFKMPSASLWASLAERFFYRKEAGKSADFPAFAFHGRELDGKRQRGRKQAQTPSVIACGNATSLMEGGFIRAAKLLARVQSLRARPLPCGELPQQRLRGLEIGVTQKIL